jgi:glycosyltransferase involved in cell wall biosynthesis
LVNVPPTFSFLTTAYRTEPYVAQTIASVLAQTRGDWELIVVDNGMSEEMSRSVSPFLTDDRITLIRQENNGVRGGVTAAAAVAKGRYLCPLDSDDLLHPTYCEQVGALIDANPGIDAVGSDADLFTDSGNGRTPSTYFDSIGRRSRPDAMRAVSLSDMFADGVPVYTGAFKRELWWVHEAYDPRVTDVEPDVALWLRMAAVGHDVRVSPHRLATIRIRPDSSSHDLKGIEDFETRLERAFRLTGGVVAENTTVLNYPALRRVRYARELRRARGALLDGDIGGARAAATAAFRLCRGPRAALVIGGLYLMPNAMRRAHPLKNRSQRTLRSAWFRITRRRNR